MTKPSVTKNSETLRAPHRATRAVVRAEGSAEVRALYSAFAEYNRAHFRRKLEAPLLLVTQTGRALGDYIARDEHGLRSRIRISPRALARGERFMLDVLLHEMCHAWAHEVDDANESGYRGHGPLFAATCNRIGAKLGLAPVGVKGRDGLPDCAYWPMNVRPADYYPEPFEAPKREARSSSASGADESESDGESDGESERDERAPRLVPPALSARALLGAALGAEILRERVAMWEPEDRQERRDRSYLDALARYLEKLAESAPAAPTDADMHPGHGSSRAAE
jgi:hypothetical protein